MKTFKILTAVLVATTAVAGCQIKQQKRETGYQPPAINQMVASSNRKDSIRVYTNGRSQDPNKVRVCLHQKASGKNKGMHWRLDKKPRYVARRKGDLICGEHPTGNRTVSWYLYRPSGIGGWKPVAEYRLNVNGRAGQRIIFAWERD